MDRWVRDWKLCVSIGGFIGALCSILGMVLFVVMF